MSFCEAPKETMEMQELQPSNPRKPGKPLYFQHLRGSPIPKREVRDPAVEAMKSASFCYTWVIMLHFSLTMKSNLAYDFATAFFLKWANASPLLC
jgi:hypothetical protein